MLENLWLSAIYNALAVPLALAGLVNADGRRDRDVRLLAGGDAQRAARAARLSEQILASAPNPWAPGRRHGNVILFASAGAGMDRPPLWGGGVRGLRDAGQDEDPGGQLQPADRRSHRRLSRRAADAMPCAPFRRSRNLRRNSGERARPRRLHRAVDVLSDQRQSDGAADHDRRAEARVGAAASRR